MELTEALAFARNRKQGVLATIRANGRPQLSNIAYVPDEGDTFLISITDDRAKTANLRRDPRASLYVLGDNFYQYVVIEAAAELSPVAADPHDATVEALIRYYEAALGRAPGLGRIPGGDDRRQAARTHAAARARLRDPRLELDAGRAPATRAGYGQVVPTRLAWALMPACTGAAAAFADVTVPRRRPSRRRSRRPTSRHWPTRPRRPSR